MYDNLIKLVKESGAETGYIRISGIDEDMELRVIIGAEAIAEYEAFSDWRSQEHLTHEAVIKHLEIK